MHSSIFPAQGNLKEGRKFFFFSKSSLENIPVWRLLHTPWHGWQKQFVLLLCLGSSDDIDAQPVVDLFKFITAVLGPKNRVESIIATRLAVVNQITMTREELSVLYPKLQLPSHLVEQDFLRNHTLLKRCYDLGLRLGAEKN